MIRKDNRGLSIVELVIVIAIMAIVIGMLAASLNYIGNSQARSLANAIKTSIGQTRIQTMGKNEVFLYIYRGSDKRYYKETWRKAGADDTLVRENREMLGKDKPSVKYYIKDDTDEHVIDGTGGLLITFDRSNGKEIDTRGLPTGSQNSEGTEITTPNGNKSVLCNKILVSYGSKEYVIEITPETGKIHL